MLNNDIVLRTTDSKDIPLVKKLFDSKRSRELRNGREIFLKCEIDAPYQTKTFKQLASVWKLITVIFESMEDRRPTEEEKYDLYLDLLEEYADKVPSKINTNALRNVRISESNTVSAARFIDGLLFHLVTMCDLTSKYNLQADVRSVLYEWSNWVGQQDIEVRRDVAEWKEKSVYSEASGLGGDVDCHHILSRGAYPQYESETWNFLALTREEHSFFHSAGVSAFIEKYPHLQGKIDNAYRKIGSVVKTQSAKSLAMLALGE